MQPQISFIDLLKGLCQNLWSALSNKSKKFGRLSKNRENIRSTPAQSSLSTTPGVNFTNILPAAF